MEKLTKQCPQGLWRHTKTIAPNSVGGGYATFGSNHTLRDKKLIVEADDLLFAIKNVKEASKAAAERLEPAQKGSTAMLIESSYAVDPKVLRDLDSNQDTLLQRQMSYH